MLREPVGQESVWVWQVETSTGRHEPDPTRCTRLGSTTEISVEPFKIAWNLKSLYLKAAENDYQIVNEYGLFVFVFVFLIYNFGWEK